MFSKVGLLLTHSNKYRKGKVSLSMIYQPYKKEHEQNDQFIMPQSFSDMLYYEHILMNIYHPNIFDALNASSKKYKKGCIYLLYGQEISTKHEDFCLPLVYSDMFYYETLIQESSHPNIFDSLNASSVKYHKGKINYEMLKQRKVVKQELIPSHPTINKLIERLVTEHLSRVLSQA
ncbi:Hypothetical_protein [Hexamita inflata]|uniref:Hypothetical_protein n=1 Tax=Hexamita inflata TaxID=28002 RepID=A0AA86UMQ9_9EUKA|nr:Hypothetical protein HINF_LOCUS32020 [Hexamita inflata]CAI9964420.1 Hypothetical protein HINF_LOCUS52065 [Hexamita inflata]CAI9973003.1 Hypothetical protein HINF_LOCUS60648 [Hexamita inflata]